MTGGLGEQAAADGAAAWSEMYRRDQKMFELHVAAQEAAHAVDWATASRHYGVAKVLEAAAFLINVLAFVTWIAMVGGVVLAVLAFR